MLPRRFINPEDHWKLRLKVAKNSPGIVCNKMIFIGAQVDMDARARIRHPGDLAKQTIGSMEYMGRVLAEAGADMADLVKITGFYVNDGHTDEHDLLAQIADCLGSAMAPGPAVTLVPMPGLLYPDTLIEIEAIAMRHLNGWRLRRTAAWSPDCPRLPHPFSHALRCEEMIFTSGITAMDGEGRIADKGDLAAQSRIVLPKLDELLHQLGADLNDSVKANVFNAEPGQKESWGDPALIRASYYREPGPTATGISFPYFWPEGIMLKNDVIAMRGVDGSRLPRIHVWPSINWDWPVHLPYRHGVRCGDLAFLGGQVSLAPDSSVTVLDKGDMVAQTRRAMGYIGGILGELGLSFEHVLKVNSFYTGGVGEEVLRPNGETILSFFPDRGPTLTGVSAPYLAYEGMMTEIDIVAMV
jgi:enamine deaminase RidA (YjgF/YER057c/UK114 family)